MDTLNLFAQHTWIIVLLFLWTLPWKGIALWRAAKNGDKPWFIGLLLVNSAGVLEIIYIFFLDKRRKKQLKQ